jgi:hypothetical protein
MRLALGGRNAAAGQDHAERLFLPDHALQPVHAPLFLDLARQIDAMPANHPVLAQLGTCLHPPGHHCRLLVACSGVSFAAEPGAGLLHRPARPAAL